MKQLVLEKIVISGFPPVNKRCLWLKGNTFHYWYKGAWRSIESNIDIDNLDEVVEQTVSTEIDKVIGGASESFDTFGELETYVSEHEIEAEERDSLINANAEAIKTLEDKIAAGTGIPSAWEGFEN